MKVSEIREDRKYYVRKENIKKFIDHNYERNGIINKDHLKAYKNPSSLIVIAELSDRAIIRRGDNYRNSYSFKNIDFALVEEYVEYVQEEMEL